jgi:hypothetical protein
MLTAVTASFNPQIKQLRQHRERKPMEQNPLTKGVLTENFIGIGTVTREMVLKRAQELAMINGHSPKHVLESELEQAQRELTGGSDMDPKEASLESVPESERWDPVPGSTGHKVRESSDEDEDNEGRGEEERLVEEGVNEAEHDQMLQAAKAAVKEDNEGR